MPYQINTFSITTVFCDIRPYPRQGECHVPGPARVRVGGCQSILQINPDIPLTRKVVQHIGIDFRRSEEHTSELQSLMRISYAVFCLKKKKNKLENIIH